MKSLSHQQIAGLEALEARFALRLGSALSESAAELPADVGERLRFARQQALGRRKHPKEQTAPAVVAAGNAAALGGGPAFGKRLLWFVASVLPWLLLVAGLVFIHEAHLERQVQEAADIDSALLADDLPPSAYTDPGFAAFLKAPPR